METKKCSKCQITKPTSQFYVHNTVDYHGYQSHCKSCQREENRITNRKPERKAYNAKFVKRLTEAGYFQKYQSRPEVKKRRADRARQYSQDPRLRARWYARWHARQVVKSGKIEQQPCALCGAINTQIHHPDYDQPLLIVWLCPNCHRQLHKTLNTQEE